MKKQKVIRVPKADAPAEKKIVFCISLYFAIPDRFSRQNFQFKPNLKVIADKRNFLESISDKLERDVFKTYLSSRKPKVDISVLLTKKTNSGVYLINKNLQRFVDEIMSDYEAGILKIQDYTKPLTQTQINKKINEFYKRTENNKRIPLREKSLKEITSDWKEKNAKFDQLSAQTGEEN